MYNMSNGDKLRVINDWGYQVEFEHVDGQVYYRYYLIDFPVRSNTFTIMSDDYDDAVENAYITIKSFIKSYVDKWSEPNQ